MNRVISRPAKVCCLFAVLSLLCMVVVQAGFAANPRAQERGAVDFQTKGCPRCHSITGVGGTRGPDLGSVALRRNAGQIRKQITRGGHGMPPFGKVLTKSEVGDLVAFLSSCRTNEAPGCRTWNAPASH